MVGYGGEKMISYNRLYGIFGVCVGLIGLSTGVFLLIYNPSPVYLPDFFVIGMSLLVIYRRSKDIFSKD